MKVKITVLSMSTIVALAFMGLAILTAQEALAYPPSVGILMKMKNCLDCHLNNGPWKDEAKTIIDIIDRETKKSLKQPDGSFLIEAKRGEAKTVLTLTYSPPLKQRGFLQANARLCESAETAKTAEAMSVPD